MVLLSGVSVGCGQNVELSDLSAKDIQNLNQGQSSELDSELGVVPGVDPATGAVPEEELARPTDVVEEPELMATDWRDSAVKLNSVGETFQASIAQSLKAGLYMEGNCVPDMTWKAYGDLPVKRCKYSTGGQTAEVVMLNPGPRRMTAWLMDACSARSGDLVTCMNRAYKQIRYQSGGQFPIAGVVIEDMNGNGRGEAFTFREGVTIRISTFGTGTESKISASQVKASMTATPMYTYTYARPISLTREKMTSYAKQVGLSIPNLGTTSERKNNWHVLTGQLYREAWKTGRNHIIRAWIW